MAQLNPNFEIDFNDINSFEQVQLINDTQLAKENLLMHRAYKEPSDDEVIRNHFSSFTFVDFCPKLFSSKAPARLHRAVSQATQSHLLEGSTNSSSIELEVNQSGDRSGSKGTIKYFELETFSDLFERINNWLKLNKDWRVVSMETLVHDCSSQFNHAKSSIHTSYLPQNTRGLRLYLTPSKSRFTGPQKIGCINVTPRKISGSYLRPDEPIVYENLDQILNRLNELLLTRPIEGRILSVETITLPIVDGYVNTESNYFMDSRLNLLTERTYNMASDLSGDLIGDQAGGSIPSSNSSGDLVGSQGRSKSSGGQTTIISDGPINGSTANQKQRHPQLAASCTSGSAAGQASSRNSHALIDILRVYYEFGPMVCGLVNLIDFVPRFYSPTPSLGADTEPDEGQPADTDRQRQQQPLDKQQQSSTSSQAEPSDQAILEPKVPATESLTRLIRRSLAWFEAERKQLLSETKNGAASTSGELSAPIEDQGAPQAIAPEQAVNLKLCNLQVHKKHFIKRQLVQVTNQNVVQVCDTRTMGHTPASALEPLVCAPCSKSTSGGPSKDWCTHLIDLSQPYELKFVRLAYIVPVFNRYARSLRPMRPLASRRPRRPSGHQIEGSSTSGEHQRNRSATHLDELSDSFTDSSSSSLATPSSSPASCSPTPSRSPSASSSQGLSGRRSGASTPEASFCMIEPEDVEPPVEDTRDTHAPQTQEAQVSSDEAQPTSGRNSPENPRYPPPPPSLPPQSRKCSQEQDIKQELLGIVQRTNERHQAGEQAHHMGHNDQDLDDSPIGQLTYRLFAPCQLVKSSSCFSINPVNSSSPLARRGSVDLNGAGISSDNAHPSSHLLLNTNGSSSSSPSSPPIELTQQFVNTLGPFFPAMSRLNDHQISSSEMVASVAKSQSSASRFTTNEFEPVESIRRRMEVYVTTNPMKVIAGETLIVNLSDVLSCLSTAIEQTVLKAPFALHRPTTWVSVYVLYAAVEVPLLPDQLLASQQKMRQLTLISEETGPEDEEGQLKADGLFDDDFNGTLYANETKENATSGTEANSSTTKSSEQPASKSSISKQTAKEQDKEKEREADVEQKRKNSGIDSSLIIYNSAYDRAVPLPIPPDNYLDNMDPIDFLGSKTDCLWLDDENLLIETKSRHADYEKKNQRHKKSRRSKKSRHEESQCSIM